MCRDYRLILHCAGDLLTLNGDRYDFLPLPEGAVLPRYAVDCDWLASDITRKDGHLHLTLILPHGADAPTETRFLQPIMLEADGPVTLPPHGTDSGPAPLLPPQPENDDAQN